MFYFRQVQGLDTDEIRSNVVRDHEGFVWIGTLNGLDRWDGYGVKEYRHDPDDPHSISSAVVKALLVDTRGRLWVGTYFTGLSLYDRAHDRFINFLPRSVDSLWFGPTQIVYLTEDRSGNIWVGTIYGGVVRAEVPRGDFEDLESLARGIRFTTFSLGTPRNLAESMVEREDGKMVIGSDSGVIVLDPALSTIGRLHLADRVGRRLDSLPIAWIQRDRGGTLWIASVSEGLFRIGRDSNEVANYRHRKGDAQSIRSDTILQIAEDRQGNLWLAGGGGVDLFSPSTGRCIPYLTIGSDPDWPVEYLRLSLDREGVLWLSSYDGGLHWLSPKSERFPLFGLRDGGGSNPIYFWNIERDSSGGYWFMSVEGVLYQIDIETREVSRRIDVLRGELPLYTHHDSFIDKRGFYWYGAAGLGLCRVDLKSGEVRKYSIEAGLRGKTVNSIAEGEGDTLWIAAYLGGLMKFAIGSEEFIWVKGLNMESIWSVMKDRQGEVWIGSEVSGLAILDPATGATERFKHNPSDPRSLAMDRVRFTYEDPLGQVWVGAGSVVHLWDSVAHSFTRYSNPEVEGGQFVDPLGLDRKGRLWITYAIGGDLTIAVLDPSSGTFTNFGMSDGLCAWLAMQTLSDGRVLLNNQHGGVNIFHPDSIDIHRPPPPLVLTRMAINDERVVPPQTIDLPAPLRLPFSRNVFECEFAAIDVDAPGLVRYQYMLEGLEREWVHPKDRRFVRYPGLPPGDYLFKVRAASLRHEWPDQEIALAISIAPPWWRTTWAYASYGLLVVSMLYAGYRLRLRQLQLKQNAEMEHFQVQHLAEVDRLKTRFFSNISHEFRTPLTLIIGPTDQLLETTAESASRQKLRLIRDNAKKLSALVTQLLDFSRLESGMMRLQVSGGDIVPFLRRVVMSFESWAERKKVTLEFHSETDSLEGFIDRDKLEKIVNNLMSNALKYTAEGGRVAVTVTQFRIQNAEFRSQNSVRIAISDTGAGIAPGHLPHIFDRFYRVDETHTTEGTGIGLALTRELVELHHGTIAVESTTGKGSCFTVALPVDKEMYKPEEISESMPEPAQTAPVEGGVLPPESTAVASAPVAEGKPIVLVVEDNEDLRVYIREYLEAEYAIREAGHGKEGYAQALETIPDLVISDVMMPEMDGMELCRALKHDVRTSHVPVILLTARAGTDSKVEGLETGADDYVTKPFDSRELLARVRNLIDQRKRLREKFSAGVVLKPGEVAVTSIDDAFLKKVMEAVEKNMRDEEFGVDDLAREAFLSKTQLNCKLSALTNLSPAKFIRYVRLQRAYELLEKKAGTIAEIAYQVGFGSPSHFGACFRERFGYTPSDVLHKRPS